MTSPTTHDDSTPFAAPPPGQVRKAGRWVVGNGARSLFVS